MPTEAEIKANYKEQHDTLSASYYGGQSGLTKEEFDDQHAMIWDAMEAELIAEGYLIPSEPPEPFVPGGSNANQRIATIEAWLTGRFG